MEVLQIDGVVLDLAPGGVVEAGRADLELEHHDAARADQDRVGPNAEPDDAELDQHVPLLRVGERGESPIQDCERTLPGADLRVLVDAEPPDGFVGKMVEHRLRFGGDERGGAAGPPRAHGGSNRRRLLASHFTIQQTTIPFREENGRAIDGFLQGRRSFRSERTGPRMAR